MKRTSLILASALVFAAPVAQAADMAVKAPAPPAAPVMSWTGFYLGVNVGYVIQSDPSAVTIFTQPGTDPFTPQSLSTSATSFIGGGQWGYNWQFNNSWVLGYEGDFKGLSTSTSFCRETDRGNCVDGGNNNRGALFFNEKTQWLTSERARLGVTWNSLLVYGTGGVAWGRINSTETAACATAGCGNNATSNVTTASFSNTRSGWVAGLGTEAMFWSNWSAKLEYLHYDLGSLTNAFTTAANVGSYGVSWTRKLHYDTVSVGLNYHFGGWR